MDGRCSSASGNTAPLRTPCWRQRRISRWRILRARLEKCAPDAMKFLPLLNCVCYPEPMIHWLAFGVVSFFLLAAAACSARAAAYPLTDGTSLDGEPISYNAQG